MVQTADSIKLEHSALLPRLSGWPLRRILRTLSERGNPRLDTLAVILAAFGLRWSV